MKLNKEDLKKKVNEIVTDNDVAIQLLEDIEDSFDESAEVDNSKIDELQAKIDEQQSKIDELQEKYKERFLTGNKEEKQEDKKPEDNEGLEEKNIIDIKEI
jgi:hypothetical protein